MCGNQRTARRKGRDKVVVGSKTECETPLPVRAAPQRALPTDRKGIWSQSVNGNVAEAGLFGLVCTSKAHMYVDDGSAILNTTHRLCWAMQVLYAATAATGFVMVRLPKMCGNEIATDYRSTCPSRGFWESKKTCANKPGQKDSSNRAGVPEA